MYANMLSFDDSIPHIATEPLDNYDGFATVQEPKQYLDAPAMLMTRAEYLNFGDRIEFPDDSIGSTSAGDSHTWSNVAPASGSRHGSRSGSSQPEPIPSNAARSFSPLSKPFSPADVLVRDPVSEPPTQTSTSVKEWLSSVQNDSAEAVRTSLEAAAAYTPLSEQELREYLAEIDAIDIRISEVAHILDVENKMHKAADSLSRMQLNDISTHSQSSKKGHARSSSISSLQKGLSPSHGARRISQWLSPFLNHSQAPSSPSSGMGSPRMARTGTDTARVGLGVSGSEPRGSHRRNTSSTSQMAEAEMALSMSHIQQLQYAQEELRRRKRSLDCRIAQHHAAVLARATGTTSPGPISRTTEISRKGLEYGNPSNTELQSLEPLVARLLELVPSNSLIPDTVQFVRAAIEQLATERDSEQARSNALLAQAEASEVRVKYLANELARLESANSTAIPPETAEAEACRIQLTADLAAEQRRCAEYRSRLDTQRVHLETVVHALEDVTSLAVSFERERIELRAVIHELETRLERIEEDSAKAQAAALPATALPGALSKAYREIIHELAIKHAVELREVRRTRLSLRNVSNTQVLDSAVTAAAAASQSLANFEDGPGPIMRIKRASKDGSTKCNSPLSSLPDQMLNHTHEPLKLQPSPIPEQWPSDSVVPKIPPRNRASIQLSEDLL